jgi:hypothetical protein
VVGEEQGVGGEQRGQDTQLKDSFSLVPHHQPALDHVLHQHHVEGGKDGGVCVGLQLGYLHYCFVRVPAFSMNSACMECITVTRYTSTHRCSLGLGIQMN